VWALIPPNRAANKLSRTIDSLQPQINESFINLVVTNNVGNGGSTMILELGRETVLKYRIDLLSEKYLIRSVGPCLSLLSTQIFEEFGISRHLLDGIMEWEVDFYLFEDLHHILYFLSLIPKMGMCLETFWEWDSRFIWYLRNGNR
jgi:hypothetical protein